MNTANTYTRCKSPSGCVYKVRKDHTGIRILMPRFPLFKALVTVFVFTALAHFVNINVIASALMLTPNVVATLRVSIDWIPVISLAIGFVAFFGFSNELHLNDSMISRHIRFLFGQTYKFSIPYATIESLDSENDGRHWVIRIRAPSHEPAMLTIEGFRRRADRDWFFSLLTELVSQFQNHPQGRPSKQENRG